MDKKQQKNIGEKTVEVIKKAVEETATSITFTLQLKKLEVVKA